jgi:hypothetical protein
MTAPRLRLVVDSQESAIVDAAVECERRVFMDRYGITDDEMRRDYRPYDAVSFWLTVHEPDGGVIAGSRLIPPNPLGQKSLEDVSRPPWLLDAAATLEAASLDPTTTWDVATLFRERSPVYSGAHVMAALCYGIVHSIRYNGGNALVTVLESVTRDLLDRLFAIRMRMLPGAGSARFMNAPREPVFAFVSEMLEHSRRVNPEGHRSYVLGGGLNGVDLPAPVDFARKPGGQGRWRVVDLRESRIIPTATPTSQDATT